MEPGKRRKPLRNNVRTGCITCKQRRVKCPEQRPHCSRCIKAGFDCAGYAIPVARIFKSSAETTNDSDEARSKSSEQSPSTTSSTSESPDRWSSKRPLPLVSIRSPVQLGNSDPFNALPIRLGPCETRLLRIYPALLMPRSDRSGSRQVVRLPAAAGWTHYGIGLEDEAAAYSLLARSAALENWNLNGWNAAPSIPLIKYVTMSQAALHRKLPLLGGFQTPEIVYSVMWTSAILAMADMFMGSLNVHIYSRAMCKMMVLYVELAGRDFQPEMILYPLGVDGIRSLSTMTRSNVDMIHWFPQVFRNMWDKAAILCPNKHDDMSTFHVHTDVKDAVLRDIILSQQENRKPYLDAQNTRMNATDRLLIANTVRTQELFRYGQLLDIAFDETKCLEELPSLPKQPSQLMEDQIARLYMTFATLLWMNLTSPTSFASNAMMDSTPFFLKQLKATIRKSNWHQNVRPDSDGPYATAKLWALFVGVHAELQHRDTHKADFVCADWFFKAFQAHADAMSIRSWQQSVILLRQILYSDRMRPHISEWWHRVFPVVKSESVDDKWSFFS